jgi:arylsulfatase A-like enzyme/Tfp pilus assembly protein PilF
VIVWIWAGRGRPFALPPPGAAENILLVTVEALRADALSSYGGRVPTPNLDRLAAHGARFTFAHAHAVTTLVSHVTILTGRLPHEHAVQEQEGARVAAGTQTVATLLDSTGLSTAAFVSSPRLAAASGLARGFDLYDDEMPAIDPVLVRGRPDRRADAVVDRAVQWIDTQGARFFCWVQIGDPAAPYQPPPEDAGAHAARPYDGEVAFVDRALGRLFDRLTALTRPTLVIVTADHGESLGDHGEPTHGLFAYESTLRVPLILARVVPDRAEAPAAGRVIASPVRLIDILPTILDVAGAKPAEPIAGASLREVVSGGGRTADRPTYFEALTPNRERGWAPLRGVIEQRTKYIELPVPELYDLGRDPGETANLAPARKDQTSALAGRLRALQDVAPRALADVAYRDADDPKMLSAFERELDAARTSYALGQTEEAATILTRLLERQPAMADAYLTLAGLFWQTARPAQAIHTLETAVARGLSHRVLRLRLGGYLARSDERPQRAIAVLKDLAGDDPDALQSLGIAYGNAGRHADALAAFSRILARDPVNAATLQEMASLQLREALAERRAADRAAKLREAEATVRQAIAADPALPRAYTTLGVLLVNTGRRADAIVTWKKALQLDAAEFPALYHLVVALSESGRFDEAASYGQQFVGSAPSRYQREIGEIRRLLAGRPTPHA